MTDNWRVAKSLLTLREQINRAAPNRSKASDGTIGDVAHSKTKSDHNPDKDGVVKAMDITHDPAHGVNCHVLAASLIDSRDPRILYIIWNRRIANSQVQPWVWRGYGGANPHDHHMHISVKADPALYDSTTAWDFSLTARDTVQPPKTQPAPQRPPTPQPPVARPQPAPEPEDALAEPDTRSGWEKFIDWLLGLFRKIGE